VRLATFEVTIAAPVQVVWAHLTTAAGLVRWTGPDATAEPVPGGELRWTHENGASVVGRFLELVPYQRVVFSALGAVRPRTHPRGRAGARRSRS
jgi:uncharacterized protein YndB with AHSA1/START domain